MSHHISKIDHIGIAVKDLEAQLAVYRDTLNIEFKGVEEVADQKVKAAFLKIGETNIELLEPTSEESAVAKFLAARGDGFHHLAIGVHGIENVIEELKSKGVRMIDEKPRVGAHGKKIAFLHPKSTGGVLIELCEPQSGQ